MYDFESQIVDIPDYPEPGVIFKDITPLFGNPEALKAMTDALAEHLPSPSTLPAWESPRSWVPRLAALWLAYRWL